MDSFVNSPYTFRQGIGRGLRNNHDKVFIAVCDPRIYDKKNSSFLYLGKNLQMGFFPYAI